MGCIQAQDYGQAKWAIGLRMAEQEAGEGKAVRGGRVTRTGGGERRPVTDADVETALNEGRILRTHVLRPTWHFVLPEDIGWMIRSTGSRVKAFCRPYHRRLEIDDTVLKRSKKIMIKSMEGGKQLTRPELAALFRAEKIDTSDIRMNFLLMDAELEGLICSGARKGKQFTYALLEERVPRQLDLDGDAAVAELTRRYLTSRGPATVADLAWWSGMSLGQARMGLEMVKKELQRVMVGEVEYWSANGGEGTARKEVVLLPAFDEYTVAYTDRSAIVPPEYQKESFYGLKPVIVVRGRVAGMWKRTLKKGKAVVEVNAFGTWSQAVRRLVKKEAERYATFAGTAAGD
jgi:hypothetical protein